MFALIGVRYLISLHSFHSGQMCTASSRIFVQEGIYNAFMDRYKAAANHGKRGDIFDLDTTRGPVVSEIQYNVSLSFVHTPSQAANYRAQRVMGYIKAGKDAGAKVFTGGERDGDDGWYIQPTIFTDATPDMKISREEIFGPVTSIVKFKTEEEVLAMANNTEYGLASCVYTNDLSRAIRFASALDSGGVWVNSAAVGDHRVTSTGIKISGHGHELGEQAIDECVDSLRSHRTYAQAHMSVTQIYQSEVGPRRSQEDPNFELSAMTLGVEPTCTVDSTAGIDLGARIHALHEGVGTSELAMP